MEKIRVIKKNGQQEDFDRNKIIVAINKSANRVMIKLTDEELNKVCDLVEQKLLHDNKRFIDVNILHNIVEISLDEVNEKVAKSYREYRNYKIDFVSLIDNVYKKSQSIKFLGDKENSNVDSTLVSTKRVLVYNEFNRALYRKFNLSDEERQATEDGYIYEHDESNRRDTYNCCLFDVASVMTGGFEMGNMWYNEPKSIDTACDVLGDILSSKSSQQYGK